MTLLCIFRPHFGQNVKRQLTSIMNKISFFVLSLLLRLFFSIQYLHAQEIKNIDLKSGTIDESSNLGTLVDLNQLGSEFNGKHFAIIQFTQLPSTETREELMAHGISLSDYLPENAFLVTITSNADNLELSRFNVSRIINFKAQYKLSKELSRNHYPENYIDGELINLNVHIHSELSISEIREHLVSEGFEIEKVQEERGYIIVRLRPSQLIELAQIEAIKYIEPIEANPEPEGLRGVTLHRANVLSKIPGTGFDGTGVTVAIADDGGISHIDFQGRNTDHNTSAGGTHGDMTSGICVGSGNLDPTKRGMATGAFLNMYSIGGYPHISNALTNYTNLGTVITSTSYSQGCGGVYESTAAALDADVNTQKELLHVFSAGNSSSSTCSSIYGSLVASDGRYYGNITGGRKAAKNSIATGNLDYKDVRTSSSSRGPCEDGRLKPDICANGTGQLSTAPDNGYLTGGGTSAASPGLAGVAAMLYQQFKEANSGTEPKSSLIKGILLNTADDLGRPGPDFDHGWGRVNAKKAMEVISNLQYINDSVSNAGTNNHIISVPAGVKQLKVMVYWLDPAGSTIAAKSLVNNLDMTLKNPSNIIFAPWILNVSAHIDSLQKNAIRGIDSLNNMEQVTLDIPSAGNYTVTVNGTSIPTGPQAYHVIYSFVKDEISVTYPSGSEHLVPGETEIIRFDAIGSIGNFTIEYSANSGGSWTTLTSILIPTARHYNWNVPTHTSGNCLVRVSRGGLSDQSDSTFSIMSLTSGLSMTEIGTDSARIAWNSMAAADSFDVYLLGPKYMEIIGSTSADSLDVFGMVSDSLYWYSVRARENSNSTISRRANAKSYRHDPAPSCNSCATTITSFPWIENFEGTTDLCEFEYDDFDWASAIGSTSSLNTGPAGAYNGNSYYYAEASTPNFPSKEASFATPCLDLTATDSAWLIFAYHMYGATMGSLQISLSSDLGTTWASPIWSAAGNKGDIWIVDTVDLSMHSGQKIKLRFHATTGTSFTGDIALDDLTVDMIPGPPGCGTIVNSFPYAEGFETDFGGWRNETTSDDFDWTRNSEGTPSSATGPSSAKEGAFYLYTEASSPNYPSKNALLYSPCFDLRLPTSAYLAFDYHMYGAGMGSMEISISSNGGESWAPPIWTNGGDQGNTWHRDTINASAWVGDTILFRFSVLTAANWESDVSIDGVKLFDLNSSPLPTEHFVLSGKRVSEIQNKLLWNVITNEKFEYFSLERSENGITFIEIHKDKSNTASNEPSFVDTWRQNAFYRGRLWDFRGNEKRSNVVYVPGTQKAFSQIYISPNPSSGYFTLRGISSNEQPGYLVLDIQGKTIREGSLLAKGGGCILNLSDLPNGAYFLKIYNSQESTTKRLLKY